ncbi:MAG: hypothetical protein LBT04_08725 [Prevotellaceae bacterium]|jgi:hypothetical protein|nr:hypothetical protein [Prevotellaceae bacterium]
MTILEALELSGNYPENILISSFEKEGKFGILCYMTRNGEIHKLMFDSTATFESKEEAENCMHEIAKECVNRYK